MSTNTQPGPVAPPTLDVATVAMPTPAPAFPHPSNQTPGSDDPPPAFEPNADSQKAGEKSKSRPRREKKPPLLSRIFAGLSTLSPGFKVMGYILFAILSIAIPIGVVAGFGAAHLVIGNAILNACNFPNYTTQTSAAKIGATGAPILAIAIGIVFSCCQCDCFERIDNQLIKTFFSVAVTSAVGAGSGALGFAVLTSQSVPLDVLNDAPTDPLHMARAGALGGALFGPALYIGMIAFTLLLTVPMALPLLCGCEYLFGRSRERVTENSRSHAYCMCGATRGDDEDIAEEMGRMESMGQRPDSPRSVRVPPHGPFLQRTLMHLGIIRETTYSGPSRDPFSLSG